jgi:peptidoglycan/LPS O-acetylase OafA/YrhL
MPEPAPGRSRRIPELDGLRGVAILLVLCWHVVPTIAADASPAVQHVARSLIRYGWSGVDLFFVLSGFLLGGILLDHRSSSRYFKTFYVRRFCRILPLYYVMVALFVGFRLVGHPSTLDWLFTPSMPLTSYFVFLQNFAMARADTSGAQWLGPTWSLAVEEQFYLALPVLIRVVPRRFLSYASALAAVAAVGVRAALYLGSPHGFAAAYMLMPARADALMLGVLAALAVRDRRIRAFCERRRGVLYGMVGTLSLGVLGMAFGHELVGSPGMVLFGYSLLALLYVTVLVLAVTVREDELVGRLLRSRPLRSTGVLAYGLYLMHLPVVGLTSLVVGPQSLVGAVALVATFLLAWLSWKYFEEPFVRRGHRHQY